MVGYTDNPFWMTPTLTTRGLRDMTATKFFPTSPGASPIPRVEGGTGNDVASCVTIDASNNVYVGGNSMGMDGINRNGVTVVKYDANFNKVFSNIFLFGVGEVAYGIAVDVRSNAIVVAATTTVGTSTGYLFFFDLTTGAQVTYITTPARGLNSIFISNQVIFAAGFNTPGSEGYVIAYGPPNPTQTPTINPTARPSVAPTVSPTRALRIPTARPTIAPTAAPTRFTTAAPTRTATVAPTRSTTVAPTFDSNQLGQVTCGSFSAFNTADATRNVASCQILVCQGRSVRASLCGADTYNLATCSGDTYLRVLDANGNQVAANDNFCGSCSSVTFRPTSTACTVYTIVEGCAGNDICSGTVAVTFST